jgi:hypothetical protein
MPVPPLDRQQAVKPISEGDAGSSRRRGLDQIVDRAGGDPVHISFLDDRGECLLGSPAWLEESWKI